MKTVHLIGNAHLDPVWLWDRSAGVDAALATARSACERLDEFPAFHFTASGSWFHRQIQRLDPAMFDRVRRFIEADRWHAVGGMVIEPDCNLPSSESFARQLRHGQRALTEMFGRPATVGYNIDSFGHTAYMPRFLRDAGLGTYAFMRPGPHEKALPANLFRWRSPDGTEVVTFRIAGSYNAGPDALPRHVEAALAACPAGVDHTMVFFGVGDHGGGPTREQIAWILEHADATDGVRLVLSHPRAFFDAVAGQTDSLPVVEGELQHHAIGCYAVERRIKVALRRAERRLLEAEAVHRRLAPEDADAAAEIERAWETVLFNQFHDILGGTSLPEASATAAAELAAAEAAAVAVTTRLTRAAARRHVRPGTHRIAFYNPSDRPFDGYICHEAWTDWRPQAEATLRDEEGEPLEFQVAPGRANVRFPEQMLTRLAIPPGGWRLLDLSREQGDVARPRDRHLVFPAEATPSGRSCGKNQVPVPGFFSPAGRHIAVGPWAMSLEVYADPSDTWSHSCGHTYDGPHVGSFAWEGEWEPTEQGPLRSAIRRRAAFDRSHLWARLSAADGEPILRVQLRIVWAQSHQRLVLRLASDKPIERRTDWISGGPLPRATDGREYPLGGAMRLKTADADLALFAPDVFSASADPAGVSLTLLRSPQAAHHDPARAEDRPDQPVTDQGSHEFEVCLTPLALDDERVQQTLAWIASPPLVWDVTG